MQSIHDVALITLTAGTAIAALLVADAADESLRELLVVRRRGGLRARSKEGRPEWLRAFALHVTGIAFLCGTIASGAQFLSDTLS